MVLDPTSEMKIGDRLYNIPLLYKKGQNKVVVDKQISITPLGQKDCLYFLNNQKDIPVDLRDKISIIFKGYHSPQDQNYVAFIYWENKRWIQSWVQTSYFSHYSKIVCPSYFLGSKPGKPPSAIRAKYRASAGGIFL